MDLKLKTPVSLYLSSISSHPVSPNKNVTLMETLKVLLYIKSLLNSVYNCPNPVLWLRWQSTLQNIWPGGPTCVSANVLCLHGLTEKLFGCLFPVNLIVKIVQLKCLPSYKVGPKM